MDQVLQRMREAHELVHRAGPYLLLEILLPGGTLFALLLFIYRRHRNGAQRGALAIGFAGIAVRVAAAFDVRIVAGGSLRGERDGLEPLGFTADC